jgi:L-aspartate oxidase
VALDSEADMSKARDVLQRAMTEGAGVLRSTASLERAAETVAGIAGGLHRRAGRGAPVGVTASGPASSPAMSKSLGELANLVDVASALLAAAWARTETRGAHARREFPEDDHGWRCRLVHGGVPA